MFRIIIIICLLLTSVQAHAQLQGQAKIDSLLAELPNAKGDTNEVNLLTSISYAYYSINPDKGIEYGTKGLALAKKISWRKGEDNSYNSLGVNYWSQSDYIKALEYYKKSLKISEKLGDKKGIAASLGNIGLVYQFQSNYPKALEYYKKDLKINKELGNKKGIAVSLSNIGLVYQSQSNYPKALEYFDKSLKIKEEIGDKRGIAVSLGNKGIIYEYQSNYTKALEYYFMALKINEELGSKSRIANSFVNIGILYYNQSNYTKALEYFDKSLKIKEELGDKNGIAINLGNMAVIHADLMNYSEALEYNKKALKIYEKLEKKSGISNVLGNIANVYQNQSDYPKALEYHNSALKIDEELGNKSGAAKHLGNIGSLYLELSSDNVNITPNELNKYISLNKDINLNKSIEYSRQAIKIGKQIGELDNRSEFLKTLAKAYKQKGEYKKWGETLEEHYKIRDSVFNQENSDRIAALEKAREDDLKQKEIEKQKLKIAEQEKREKLILYFSIGFIIVMAVVMFIIYRLLKRSDKLLYNVLPVSIAKRLKKKEHPISDYFTQASIVFIDIVNFTEMAKDEDPRKLVEALNAIFTHFDTIANKYGLEKIKTIGDSYMAAAGIPEVQKDNTHRAAQMALEVKQMMSDYHTGDGTKIEVRIGLDCGPVVAGVIGENKFIYDMWSDAVNTASRMETSSEAGQVHITERFKEAVSEYEEFEYLERGEIEIKGKGMMKTYYIGESKETSHSEAT